MNICPFCQMPVNECICHEFKGCSEEHARATELFDDLAPEEQEMLITQWEEQSMDLAYEQSINV